MGASLPLPASPAPSPSIEFHRSADVAELNRLLNHPSIRPNMGGAGILDGAPLLQSGFMYLCEHGGALFHGEDGLVEGHYLFLPSLRGAEAMKMALGMINACVLEPSHRMLWGRVPVQNRAARLFTRKLGFVSLGIRDAPLPSEIFVWKRAPWALSATSLGA